MVNLGNDTVVDGEGALCEVCELCELFEIFEVFGANVEEDGDESVQIMVLTPPRSLRMTEGALLG